MATPTFRAIGTIQQSASGNPTAPGIPAGTVATDLLSCFVLSADNVVSSVAGFTNEPRLTGNNGTGQRFAVFYKWAVGGDTAPAVTHAAGNSCTAFIIGVAGAAPGSGNPYTVVGTPSLNASSLTCTATGITPVGTTDLVFWLGVCGQAGTGTQNSYGVVGGTNPTFTERADSPNFQGIDEVDCAVDTGAAGTGAATGTRTSTMVGGMMANMGVMFTVNDIGPPVPVLTPSFNPVPFIPVIQAA